MPTRAILALFTCAGGAATGAAVATYLDRLYPAHHDRQRTTSAAASSRRRLVLLAVATALLWGACAVRADDIRQYLLMSLFGTALVALSATDFERHLLPNRLMYPCLLAALLFSAVWPARTPVTSLIGGAIGSTWPNWVSGAVGATLSGLGGGLAGTIVMLVVFLVFPGFGFGDVKLGGLIGLIVGFPAVLTGLLIGMLLGGLGAAALLISGRARLRSTIAYGPYLAGGAILVMLWRH